MELSEAQITQFLTVLKAQSDVIICKSCKHYKTEQCYGCIEKHVYTHWKFREPCPSDCAGVTKTQIRKWKEKLTTFSKGEDCGCCFDWEKLDDVITEMVKEGEE